MKRADLQDLALVLLAVTSSVFFMAIGWIVSAQAQEIASLNKEIEAIVSRESRYIIRRPQIHAP